MNNENELNIEFFDENINNGNNFNLIHKKTFEKENNIIENECALNYLLDNDHTKPFIPKNYMMKSEDNSYFQKFNIHNYKTKFKDLLNKNKKAQNTIENSITEKILNILEKKNDKKNYRSFRLQLDNNKKKDNNENKYKSIYLNTEGNKEIKNSFYEKYLLPKIDFKKELKLKRNEDNKNSFELTDDIFKNTSIRKINEREESYFRNKISSNKYFFSPYLRKNIMPYFKNLYQRQSISVKKGKILMDELSKVHDKKYDINSYTKNTNNKNKDDRIKYIKPFDKKYHLINLFKDIGKVKSPREIEETLFKKDDNFYKLTKHKISLQKKNK